MGKALDTDGRLPTVILDLAHAKVLLEYCLVVRTILDACEKARDDGSPETVDDDSPIASQIRSAEAVVRSGVVAAAEIIKDTAEERVDDTLVDEALDALMDAIEEATP